MPMATRLQGGPSVPSRTADPRAADDAEKRVETLRLGARGLLPGRSSCTLALLVLVAVQDCCPGSPGQDALSAHGEPEPVPVEDHVVAEYLA